MKLAYVCSFLFMLLLLACTTTINNTPDYTTWLLNEKNGLIKKKCFNEICISTRYLPANYQALKSYKKSAEPFDNLVKVHEKSLTFLMEFSPDKKKGDIMYKDVEGPSDYKQRMLDLNFGMEKRITLHANSAIYAPALASFENTYGANDVKTLTLLFVPTDSTDQALFSSDTLDIELYDDIFDTGITHYIFTKKNIENTPVVSVP
ncbi:MAG: hypothetical protein KA783_00970 [Chitinophagales bacterium]|nr:hypothetical protein [Sphingobacteriales bacterium]MBP7532997.1 hypothetical protein [Chitinophagales bacterium]